MLLATESNTDSDEMDFATVRLVARSAFGEPGAHLADLWREYNDTFFGSALRPILITRSRVFAFGHCIGQTHYGDDYIDRRLVIKSLKAAVCPKQREVLIHEMLHQALFERRVSPRHAGQEWCDEIMRLTRLLGGKIWAGKYTVLREGKLTRRGNKPPPPNFTGRCLTQLEIAGWPHSIGICPPEIKG